MKIDRTKIKRSTTEVPPDCKVLIDKLKACRHSSELLEVLKTVDSWTYGKCELYHWIDILDIFDSVLQKSTEKRGNPWTLVCDASTDSELKHCLMHVLSFTTLLIEHSFSRHLYNSMEHLTTLLISSDLNLVLEVLQLLYMFSKRSNFLTRLSEEKREVLLERLTYLAESWGGKEAGFGLAACCQNLKPSKYPSTATSIHLEFLKNGGTGTEGTKGKVSEYITVIHVDDVHSLGSSPAAVMEELCKIHDVPTDKQMLLFTHIRLAFNFSSWKQRCLCVQARLQALSVLVYANAIQDNIHQLLYSGLMEELVDILELDMKALTDIKAAALRTLTSIIHLDRAQNFPNIIDVTGAGSYHGFLPMMVRSCISSLTSPPAANSNQANQYPLPLATALFSFLYHLASYELGGEALVNCGMLESLLKVVNWNTTDVEHITFVTRAVRVIDLITNMDMQAFQAHNGLNAFINRLEIEVNACRKEQPFEIIPEISSASRQNMNNAQIDGIESSTAADRTENTSATGPNSITDVPMETDAQMDGGTASTSSIGPSSSTASCTSASNFVPNGSSCLPQRAALLKSMLNFLKKVIQDPAFSDSIRHIMESSLPSSLKHLISNAEYYGASLFLLATDVVTVYVFQEPSLLSTLQDSGLTDVVQEALLVKEVPATREVISSMPNVFSALCLNSRGLNAFVKCKPFQRLFKVLLSPEYLPAMRRRRTAEPMGDTASNLGNAMDELMRHQPSLKVEATAAIVKLLQDLCSMGQDSRFSCWKGQAKAVVSNVSTNPRNGTSEGGSSDEEEDEEELSTASHQPAVAPGGSNSREDSNPATTPSFTTSCMTVPLVDYILNVMKCVDAILSNNSTDDHCREFVNQSGLKPLMELLALPNLPIDFPNSPACQAVSSVCKSILNLAHEGKVLQEGMEHLEGILSRLDQLDTQLEAPGSSVLLRELASSPDAAEAVNNPYDTPILHAMTAAHAYVMMFIHVCRTGQSEIRTMSITHWGSTQGKEVLKKLSKLYLNLVWESTVLLAICSGEFQPGPGQFGRADLDRLIPPESKSDPEVSIKGAQEVMESDGESSALPSLSDLMEIDNDGTETNESNTSVTLVSASTQTNNNLRQDRTSNATLQNYAKLIKPVLSASSRLGRALAELFGLLVKLCVGSPLRQRRGHQHLPTIPGFVSPSASEVASLLSDLLSRGLGWIPRPNSPVPRLTFSICAVGFSAPLLFDEKKFPYHLMLKKYTDSEGLSALFDLFYWALLGEEGGKRRISSGGDRNMPDLTDHQIEFLDAWLMLLEKFVNPKTVLESPHLLPSKPTLNQKVLIEFNPNAFLAHVHKLAFEAVTFLWNSKPMKLYGTRAAESMLAILCHILRHKDQTNGSSTSGSSSSAKPSAESTTNVAASSSSTFNTATAVAEGIQIPPSTEMSVSNNSAPSGTNEPLFVRVNSEEIQSPITPITPSIATDNVSAPPSNSNITPSGENITNEPINNDQQTTAVSNEGTSENIGTNNIVTPNGPTETGSESGSRTELTTPALTQEPSGTNEPSEAGAAATTTSTSNESETADTNRPSGSTSHQAVASSLGLDVNHLQHLLDMGFEGSMAIEALLQTRNLIQATDYLLNHDFTGRGNRQAASTLRNQDRPLGLAGSSSGAGRAAGSSGFNPHATTMDWDSADNDDEQSLLRAIAISLGEPVPTTTKPVQPQQVKLRSETSSVVLDPLNSKDVDKFTETVLERCLSMLDQLPESVFRVCELLVAVGNRNGRAWMKRSIQLLVEQIIDGMGELTAIAKSDRSTALEELRDSSTASCTAIRIHLFSLIFEESKNVCALTLEELEGIEPAVQLLYALHLRYLNESGVDSSQTVTPKWLAPLLLMIDLYEKASVASHRRAVLASETDHTWKWFDINTGKWCPYAVQNNAAIDKAFWNGESSVKITTGRRRYLINFNGMIQLNEETSNRRPISIWLKDNKNNKKKDGKSLPPVSTSSGSNKQQSESTVNSSLAQARLRIMGTLGISEMDSSNQSSTMSEEDEESNGNNESNVNTTIGMEKIAKKVVGKQSSDQGMEVEDSDSSTKNQSVVLIGLNQRQIKDLIKSCVAFMGVPVEPESLHAVMRMCLRLTRDFGVAVSFAQLGGVHMLLKLTQSSGFAGFLPLSNLLIRHVIEDPQCLRYAIEKMIRAKAMSTGASTCKELHYLLRVLAPIACRSPSLFVDVAKNILRVDINCVTRRTEDDMRLIVKPVACTADNFKTYMGDSARSVIQVLLVALTLVQPADEEGSNSETNAESSAGGAAPGASIKQTQTQTVGDNEEQMDADPKASKEKDAKNEANEQQKKKLLIPKFAICQLLAESVHSYSYSCKIIAEYTFQGGSSPYVPEDCTALAFLLDRMLPANQVIGEKDCSNIVRDLISAMAGCNHLPDAQAIVISEVKAALQRALNLRESPDKHARIQALAGLICTMIESCPSMPPTHMVSTVKPTQLSMNQVVKLLIKKNLVVDLARIPHNMDLSSPNMAGTANACLKPLELITRIVNQPSLPTLVRPRKPAQAHADSINNTHTASNSDDTRAQGEADNDGDNDNTLSGAAESLDPTSESHTQDHDQGDINDDVPDVLGDIMDQLLDRDNVDEALVTVANDAHNNRMDTEQDSNQREHVYQAREFDDEHDQNDTSDSDSDPSDDDNDEDGGEGEGEDEDDEDEDDDDDEDGGSNFDDRDPEFEEEGLIRFPGMVDRDDEMLMVQYGADPENAPVFFTNNTSYNLNVGLFDDPFVNEHPSGLRTNHPLLTAPMNDPQTVTGSVTTRGHRAGRQRRYQYIQLNPRHPHPPAILQRLLGPSTAQEVIQLTTGQALTQGIRDHARLLVMDATADQPINRNGPGGANGCLANYTALHWWCEEAKALDGESMHDCVVAVKRAIVTAVEEDRDTVFKARLEKKQKENEEESLSTNPAGPNATHLNITRSSNPQPRSAAGNSIENREEAPSVPPATVTAQSIIEESTGGVETSIVPQENAVPIESGGETENVNNQVIDSMDDGIREDQDEAEVMMDTRTSLSPQEDTAALTSIDDGVFTPIGESSRIDSLPGGVEIIQSTEGDSQSQGNDTAIENLSAIPPASEQQHKTDTEESASLISETLPQTASSEPIAGPSNEQPVGAAGGTEISERQPTEDYRSILGDLVVPEGVDPSFLAALPEEIRQEVINEHLRAIRQSTERNQPQASSSTASAAPAPGANENAPPSLMDVSPEFLAALPPNIQEEVLAQQRIEQQRRVATASNPNDPVDAEAFFRNLQPALRQAILADMEESQIAVLPPELAAEAQNLRRELESRNRQLFQDHPFFVHNHSNLSSILRNSGVRLNPRYANVMHSATSRAHAQWATSWPRLTPAGGAQNTLLSGKVKGKQLVDHETLSCLLVLLFVDEPRLNTGRLHRVLRNICYHGPTRQWVIKSLLSVMERSNLGGETPEDSLKDKNSRKFQIQPACWLNISLDAALGCRANVFQIQKSLAPGKKGGSETRTIAIHGQAVPPICRHTLDVLSNLAKSFPTQFLPMKAKMAPMFMDTNSKSTEKDKDSQSSGGDGKTRLPSTSGPLEKSGKKSGDSAAEFWDLLLKLDTASSSRKGKSLAKVHLNSSIPDQIPSAVSFEASAFGQLIQMLSFPFIRRSSMLTDRLLRLLSLISLGIPDTSGYGRKIMLLDTDANKDTSTQISETYLRLIVDVITSKSCSEEGLEEATSLLLNLSYGPPATRDKILSLLVEGVKELGNVVQRHIAALMNELKIMNKALNSESKEATDESGGGSSGAQSSSSELETGDKLFKGTLINRFTKETVVVTSASKNKATCELQLPSMAALTSKTSSQAFFLRLLKVIISLRDAIRLAIKKHNQKEWTPRMSSTQVQDGENQFGVEASSINTTSTIIPNNTENSSNLTNNGGGSSSEINLPANLDVEQMDVDQQQDQRETNMDTTEARVPPTPQAPNASQASDNLTKPSTSNETTTEDKQETNDAAQVPQVDESALLPRLSSLLDLNELWETLSQCLLELGHTPDHHAVLVLQPAVEAFFLVHASSTEREEKKSNVREPREAQLAHLQQDLPPVSPIAANDTQLSNFDSTQPTSTELPPDTQKFLTFAETHRTVLNQILRQSTTHLADGPFSVLVDHTRVLDFDVKRRYFRTELERLDEGVRREDLAVHVGRSNVFEDSFRQLQRRSPEEWKNRFYIVFEGEEGQDAGGLLREWYVIISREIFNPMYALFTISPGDRVTYMINPSSHCNSNHLCYFKFVGRVIAKAIYDNKLLECYFTRSFYKHILGKSVKHIDMESEDYSFYQGLVFLMDNTVNDLGYDLTFSTEVQEFGVTEDRELIPNGANIPVTEENKMEYIRLVCQMKMTGAIRQQLNAFLEGFYDIIPKRLISIFNEQELELLVSGLPNIDIEDLKANTEYHKYQPNSLQIQWFWRALRSFDQADRAKFLQFVTGTSKVPLQGFAALEGMNGVQKFQIHRDDRSTDRLPSAHTCFNQLDLPVYETFDKLRTYLLKAIHECSEGFGFA